MKYIAKILVLVIIISLCSSLVGCSWYSPKGNFRVTISRTLVSEVVDFQIADSYVITVYTLDDSDINIDDVLLEYNEDNAVVTYKYDFRDKAKFDIYFYELSSGSELKITYNGHTVTIPYRVIDYDFEDNDYETISSIDDLDKYPEIKEMILSIKYHEFEEPFIGFDETWDSGKGDSAVWGKYDYYYRDCSLDKNDRNYIDTDYVKYFTDSVYYPEKFNSVLKNHVGSTYVYIYMPEGAEATSGMTKSAMTNFSIGYSVCDPCCTARYPLIGMSFSGEHIDYSGYIVVKGERYPDFVSILLERYPEKFFEYQRSKSHV